MALKWYTRARKFPQLIGRTPDGSRIIGGPYTYMQVAAGAMSAVVLSQTTWLWAGTNLILNAGIFLGCVAAVVFLTGKLPQTMRNPLTMIGGVTNLLTSGYQVNGKPLSVPAPRRVATVPVTVHDTHPTSQAATQPCHEPAASPTPQEIYPVNNGTQKGPALTNVQRLLLGEQL